MLESGKPVLVVPGAPDKTEEPPMSSEMTSES
jgi:hypothetical protein